MRKHPAALTAAAAALLVFFAVTFAYPLSRMLAQITPEGEIGRASCRERV